MQNEKELIRTPKAIPTRMLTDSISIADCAIRTHARDLQASVRLVSWEATGACALITAFGIDTLRIWSTSCDSLSTFINVFATLSLECVIDTGLHYDSLWVITVESVWAGSTACENQWSECATTISRRNCHAYENLAINFDIELVGRMARLSRTTEINQSDRKNKNWVD